MANIGSAVYVHRNTKAVVRTVCGNSKGFEVNVGIQEVLH